MASDPVVLPAPSDWLNQESVSFFTLLEAKSSCLVSQSLTLDSVSLFHWWRMSTVPSETQVRVCDAAAPPVVFSPLYGEFCQNDTVRLHRQLRGDPDRFRPELVWTGVPTLTSEPFTCVLLSRCNF